MTTRSIGSASARRLLTVSGVGAVVLGLISAERWIGAPHVGSWAAASDWYDTVGPAVALMSLARLVALALAVWLLVAAALELIALRAVPPFVSAIAHRIAPRSLQHFVHGLAGVSLSAGLVVVAPSAGIQVAGPEPGTATMQLIPDVPEPPTQQPIPQSTPEPPASATVEAGDSLWSIAEEALVDRGALDPTDEAVLAFWLEVIDLNRSILVDPTNPDLIYVGQEFTLPDT